MPMQELKIPAGTSLMIGAPAQPMDEQISVAIGKLTDSVEGVLEAHLPQMFAVGVMEEPAQVLVIVLRQSAHLREIAEQLESGLSRILPEGVYLDVWPVHIGNPMLDDIRGAGCRI